MLGVKIRFVKLENVAEFAGQSSADLFLKRQQQPLPGKTTQPLKPDWSTRSSVSWTSRT